MSSYRDYVNVPGSHREPLPGARAVGPAPPEERIDVTVLVRSRFSSGRAAAVEALGERPPQRRTHLTREEYEAVHGAGPYDMAQVESFAFKHGLDVVESDVARRSVVLSGTVAQMSAAFAVDLQMFEYAGGR